MGLGTSACAVLCLSDDPRHQQESEVEVLLLSFVFLSSRSRLPSRYLVWWDAIPVHPLPFVGVFTSSPSQSMQDEQDELKSRF